MNNVMIALGDYRFSIETADYQELVRVTKYRWQTKQRVGTNVAHQFLGQGSDDITLEGTIYPHYKGGLGQIEAMRNEASQGKPLMLVDGLGQIHKHWCITEIEERQTVFERDGVPLKQEFRVQLTAYGDDD